MVFKRQIESWDRGDTNSRSEAMGGGCGGGFKEVVVYYF
jgi:hypothetical protein